MFKQPPSVAMHPPERVLLARTQAALVSLFPNRRRKKIKTPATFDFRLPPCLRTILSSPRSDEVQTLNRTVGSLECSQVWLRCAGGLHNPHMVCFTYVNKVTNTQSCPPHPRHQHRFLQRRPGAHIHLLTVNVSFYLVNSKRRQTVVFLIPLGAEQTWELI